MVLVEAVVAQDCTSLLTAPGYARGHKCLGGNLAMCSSEVLTKFACFEMAMAGLEAMEKYLAWAAAAEDVNVRLQPGLEFADSWAVENHVSCPAQRQALVVEEADVSDLKLVADGRPRAALWQRHPVAG